MIEIPLTLSYDLGAHILIIQEEDQTISLENEVVALCLSNQETYKLLQVLQVLFMQQSLDEEATHTCSSSFPLVG